MDDLIRLVSSEEVEQNCIKNPDDLIVFDQPIKLDHDPIFVDFVDDSFILFNSNYVDILWDKYRIVADSIDEELNEYGSKRLPAILLPEQVQILLECGYIQVRKVAKFDAFKTPVVIKPKDILSDEEKDVLRNQAARIVCGQIIKDRKRKASDVDELTTSKKMRVTRQEVENEMKIAKLDEQQIENAFHELMSKQNVKTDNYSNLEHEAPETSYEILELNQVPFPTTNEYRLKVTVFRDLWRKGMFLTSGIKFGCHFLAYEASPTRVHSKYMVYCQSATDSLMPTDLSSLSRVGSQVRKKTLIAIVSNDSLIPYYMKLSWWKGQK